MTNPNPNPTHPTTEENTTRMTTLTKMFRGKRKYAAIGLALLAIPGSAMAAWMLTSHGQGAAKVGTIATPSVSAGVPTDTVLPGGTTSAAFHVDNSSSATLELYAVQDGDGSGSTSVPLCDKENLTVVPGTLATPIQIPPGGSDVKVPGVFRLLGGAPVECQGATLTADAKLMFRTA